MEIDIRTHFAPPERASREEIARSSLSLAALQPVRQLLDGVPEAVLILNGHRQIVSANQTATQILGRALVQVIGLRPGEALGCVHAADEKGGCGTSTACRYCGAALAILQSRRGAPAMHECRIRTNGRAGFGSLDARVWTRPIEIAGESLIVFVLRDASDEKRREVLEQLFFHDVLNAAGGLRQILSMWSELPPEEAPAMRRAAVYLAEQVVEEIEAQRDLAAAERGDLRADLSEFDAAPLLETLCDYYDRGFRSAGRSVAPPEITGSTALRTDRMLLRRVLGNLIKNGLEAAPPGGIVRVSLENSGVPIFRVHNEGAMPEEVQLQLFQRSFSTKAARGRGVGTYSVKLLIERYLHGHVSFSSSPAEGTAFTVTLPAEACASTAA